MDVRAVIERGRGEGKNLNGIYGQGAMKGKYGGLGRSISVLCFMTNYKV